MNINYKSVLFSLILNIIFSIFMAIININLGLIIMILGILIVPILINVISIKLSKKPYNILTIFIMSIFNIIYYIISAKSILHNPKFFQLASKYSHEENGFYIHMNTNLLSLSQLVFLFLLYFILSFLLGKIFTKKVNRNA